MSEQQTALIYEFKMCSLASLPTAQVLVIQHGGCLFVKHEALGFRHKLCITNVFYLKLISLTHGRGLFANGISGAMRGRGEDWGLINQCDWQLQLNGFPTALQEEINS